MSETASKLSLIEKQRLFPVLIARLVLEADSLGLALREGEGYVGDSINKPAEDTPHKRNGNHFKRIAQDFMLDVYDPINKVWFWVTKAHPAWAQLGAYWKSLHPLCRWGGDFSTVDLDHFSLEHDGIA